MDKEPQVHQRRSGRPSRGHDEPVGAPGVRRMSEWVPDGKKMSVNSEVC